MTRNYLELRNTDEIKKNYCEMLNVTTLKKLNGMRQSLCRRRNRL